MKQTTQKPDDSYVNLTKSPHTSGLFALGSQVQFSHAIVPITRISEAQVSSKDAVFTHNCSIADINYGGRLRELLEEIFGICKLVLMVYRGMFGTLQLH